MKDYQNYVFDLYGTLVDVWTDEEDPRLWAAFARYLRLLGVDVPANGLRERYLRLCKQEQKRIDAAGVRKGLTGPFEIDLPRVWRHLGRECGVSLTRRQTEEISRVFRALTLRRLRACPGAAGLLTSLRAQGKRVFLLSNAQASFTMPELRHLRLSAAFDAIFLSSDAGVKKPSPDFFGLLWQRSLRPADTLMIGNDPDCDCRGAARAGMDSLFIRTRQSPQGELSLPENCREIHDLSDVMRFSQAAERT